MAQPIRSANVIRFEGFEVDLRAQELYKAGRKIKLQVQPFQVLAMLLERPGEVVTRDEMQKRLWTADTFVDFDHSVNTADQEAAPGFRRRQEQAAICRNAAQARIQISGLA